MEEDWDASEESIIAQSPKTKSMNTPRLSNTDDSWKAINENQNTFEPKQKFKSVLKSYDDENWDENPLPNETLKGDPLKYVGKPIFNFESKSNMNDQEWGTYNETPANFTKRNISHKSSNLSDEDWDMDQSKPIGNFSKSTFNKRSNTADEEDWDMNQLKPMQKSSIIINKKSITTHEEDWDDQSEQICDFSKSTYNKSSKKADEEESWDDMDMEEDDSNNRSKRMSEREREEQLFKKQEDMESRRIRMRIKRQLSNRDNELDVDASIPENKSTVSPAPKRLKVSDIFGDSNSSENEEPDPDISSIGQLESIRVSRSKLKEWLYMPFFSDRIPGFFVRVNIGSKDTEPVYKIAQIVEVVDQGITYSVENLKTSKRLKLSICNRERSFRISYISNQPFTHKEFDNWTTQHKSLDFPLPKISEVNEKQEDMEYCLNYRLSDADIDKMVAEKQKFEEIPKDYAISKKKLENDLELAVMEGNSSRVEKLKEELMHVAKEYDKITQRTISRINVANISNEDRLKEMEFREKLIEQECLIDKGAGDDPFTRRKTAPTMVEFINSKTLKEETRARLIKNRANRFKPVVEESDDKDKLPQPPPQENTIDLRELHNFDLDIILDI